MHTEGLRYPVTPVGMHYLLIHFDIPFLAPKAYQLSIGGSVRELLTLSLENIKAPQGHRGGDNGVRGHRPPPSFAGLALAGGSYDHLRENGLAVRRDLRHDDPSKIRLPVVLRTTRYRMSVFQEGASRYVSRAGGVLGKPLVGSVVGGGH